jgi:hypothetical protein
LVPHRGMFKLKSLSLFFIALCKNHLSTPNFFADVLPFLMFLESTILQSIYCAFTPSLFKAPTLWLKLLERFLIMCMGPFNCLHWTC